MKHSKKILIYSGYAMILGLVLAAAAFLSGAKIDGVVFGENGAQIIDSGKYSSREDNLAKFDSIDLDIDRADVKLVPSDHYGAEFVHYGKDDTFSCNVENGTLKISTKDGYTHGIMCFNLTPVVYSNTLDIYYPKNTKFKNLKIYNINGNFSVSGLKANIADISLPYGSIDLDNADCGSIGINMENGKCGLKNIKAETLGYKNNYGSGTFEDINISGGQNTKFVSTNGSLTLTDFICGNLEADSNYGNISFDSLNVSALKSTLKDGNLSMNNSTVKDSVVRNSYGRVTLDGVKSDGADIKCNDGEININGELKGKTQLSSDYGKIIVKTSLPKEKYSYAAVTKYGNVKIDGKKSGMNISNGVNAENTIYAEAKNGDVALNFGIK